MKATNPKDIVANTHVKFTDLPFRVLARIALALSEGAWKYGRHNYRIAGVRATVYVNACLDHLFAWAEGEDIDPDSKFNHIDKAIASLFVLRDSMLEGNMVDDRAPAVRTNWIKDAHDETAALYERMAASHGDPRAAFTEKNRNAPTAVVMAANEYVAGTVPITSTERAPWASITQVELDALRARTQPRGAVACAGCGRGIVRGEFCGVCCAKP